MADVSIYHAGPLISRLEAYGRGDLLFFTGIPCRRGHVAQRRVSNLGCRECERLGTRRRYRADPAKGRERQRLYRDAHPGREKEIQRRYRIANGDRLRARARAYAKVNRAKIEEYRRTQKTKAAGRKKPAVCDLCRRKSDKICFDHCHVTGTFRGWLCDMCNSALGFVNDDPMLLRRMARYIEKARIPPPLL